MEISGNTVLFSIQKLYLVFRSFSELILIINDCSFKSRPKKSHQKKRGQGCQENQITNVATFTWYLKVRLFQRYDRLWSTFCHQPERATVERPTRHFHVEWQRAHPALNLNWKPNSSCRLRPRQQYKYRREVSGIMLTAKRNGLESRHQALNPISINLTYGDINPPKCDYLWIRVDHSTGNPIFKTDRALLPLWTFARFLAESLI